MDLPDDIRGDAAQIADLHVGQLLAAYRAAHGRARRRRFSGGYGNEAIHASALLRELWRWTALPRSLLPSVHRAGRQAGAHAKSPVLLS